jgi:hypothetical protein
MDIAYQYLYIDNQQLSFREYHLTGKHFSSLEKCKKYLYPDVESSFMFSIVGKFPASRLTGELARMATLHEGR